MAKEPITKTAEKHGQFSVSDPQTEWCSEAGPDRNMKLVREIYFSDPRKKLWSVPAGYLIDGASIPRALWTLVGSPYTGEYRRASIPHDKACRTRKETRRHAKRRIGCSITRVVPVVALSLKRYCYTLAYGSALSRQLWCLWMRWRMTTLD